ncbi:hypothetical protein KGM_207536 [Danaus plexippus plexippus]|uniref:Shavenoid isoform B-like N-terminal domain-containing protein n=1 Tax=Danaus plexippus plexippus TaxID=278856 RepID=A0A212EUL4_DANPL|nr:uncharacterized protein LOC116771830 [Danaus plexippus plexippus]OWR45176.1 hypothetical protein KGM_207536 [Danaus plexippus plexippus]
MALLLLLVAVAGATSLGDLTRKDSGDVFTILDGECGAARCAEHGAGKGVEDLECSCACPQRAPLFREDRELCVDDLPECSLATFGTGLGTQRIPFVYLPLKGQIIHPSREITFQNVKTPICAVSGAQFLTRKGFLDLRNTLDADVPFNLFRDEGRTFLQWSGEDEVRKRMSGRMMVVRLLCRDISAAASSPLDLRGVFTPCVAFRVQGTPPRHSNNITEVQFAPNVQTSEGSTATGLTVSEYIAIGISSLLLGLIYVASVFLYLHIKKKRNSTAKENGLRKLKGLKKDGLTITERDIIRINNERIQSLPNVMGQDDGVVKKNPLLSVGRQFDNKTFPSDLSDSDDFADTLRKDDNSCHNQLTSVVIHRHIDLKCDNVDHHREESIERLPDEHVSIVETIDDREITRPVGTTRRKLYFNPAYFEPQLMADPPPAAIEFLSKIREVISIAKQKMAAKRFHPVLNEIPEEETYPSNANSIDMYHGVGSQRSGSLVSLKRENSRKRSTNCMGCPGCKSNVSNDIQNLVKQNVTKSCTNCFNEKGEKQNSIRKWLENIPNVKNSLFFNDSDAPNNLTHSLHALPSEGSQCKLQKQNSFSHVTHSTDNLTSHRSTSRSVRSEPSLRNYNIPLPEFNSETTENNNYLTMSRINELKNIELNERAFDVQNEREVSRQNMQTLKNKSGLPDMVNEAIALDHFSKSLYNTSSSDEERCSRNAPEKSNSDSPSGNEYETDSLERSSHKRNKTTTLDYLEVPSSQASPSLSTALPLEEELTMRNAVYKTPSSGNSNTPSPEAHIGIEENHYETIDVKKTDNIQETIDITVKPSNSYSLVSEVYVNNNYNFGSAPTSPSGSESSMGNRKLIQFNNSVAKPGCLTIELKDPPENYIKIHESDGFEPDTLDRKHLKHKESVESIQLDRQDFLTDCDNSVKRDKKIKLGSSETFCKNNGQKENSNKFNSLRNDHEHGFDRTKLSPILYSGSKSLDTATDDTWDDNAGWSSEEGRILTLELRHSKRQRQSTPPSIKQMKNLARPDILPPLPPTEDTPIYEKPTIPPKRVPYGSPVPQTITEKRQIFPRNSISCSSLKIAETDDMNSIKLCENDQRSESGRNCRRASSSCSSVVNTNTFIKGQKAESIRTKLRRRKGSNIEDSGYLSSDSTCSKQFQRKIVIAKIDSCSDSDETEDEARSESGAESVETHSVYFGNCPRLRKNEESIKNTIKTTRDSKRKVIVNNDVNNE